MDDTPRSASNAHGKCAKCKKQHYVSVRDDAWINGKAEVPCDGCGARVEVIPIQRPGGSGDRIVTARCPNCLTDYEYRVKSRTWPMGGISRGDRILVDKFSYHFEKPERYEIVVFKFPPNPDQNYIKRLIGLPGETIDVRNGDIYVNGLIARKPPRAQESLWRSVFDSRYVEKDGGGLRGAAWKYEGDGGWIRLGEGHAWRWSPTTTPTGTGWLVYGRDIQDLNTYNERDVSRGGSSQVGDVRARFKVSPQGAGAKALARITVDGEVAEAEVDLDSGSAALRMSGGGNATGVASGRDRERTIELARVDRAIELKVDGEVLGRFELDPAASRKDVHEMELRIGASGPVACTITDLRVDRDVYYLPSISGAANVRFPYRVPDRRYFFLGDNSSNSTDSRAWDTVPEGHIVGRAFLVFWPAVPGDFAVRRIR